MTARELPDKMEEECGVFGVYSPDNDEIGNLIPLPRVQQGDERIHDGLGAGVVDFNVAPGRVRAACLTLSNVSSRSTLTAAPLPAVSSRHDD